MDRLDRKILRLLQEDATGVVGVNENVLPAVVRRDETKPLRCVEELHRAFLHLRFPVSFRHAEVGSLAIGTQSCVLESKKKDKVATETVL